MVCKKPLNILNKCLRKTQNPAFYRYAPVAQLDRVSDSDSEGRAFESHQAYQKNPVSKRISGFFPFCVFELFFCFGHYLVILPSGLVYFQVLLLLLHLLIGLHEHIYSRSWILEHGQAYLILP